MKEGCHLLFESLSRGATSGNQALFAAETLLNVALPHRMKMQFGDGIPPFNRPQGLMMPAVPGKGVAGCHPTIPAQACVFPSGAPMLLFVPQSSDRVPPPLGRRIRRQLAPFSSGAQCNGTQLILQDGFQAHTSKASGAVARTGLGSLQRPGAAQRTSVAPRQFAPVAVHVVAAGAAS